MEAEHGILLNYLSSALKFPLINTTFCLSETFWTVIYRCSRTKCDDVYGMEPELGLGEK